MGSWSVIWWLKNENLPIFTCAPWYDDLAWLGDGGWVFASDNLNLGLRTV